MERLSTNPEIIKNYDFLERTGIIEHIDTLNFEIHDLERVFKEAWEITSKNSIDEIIEYVVSRLLERFVPSFFSIILQERTQARAPMLKCYRNMQPVDSILEIDSLDPYREFFLRYPNAISFPLFEYKMNDPPATEVFHPLEPEIIVPIIGFWGLYGLIVIGKKILEGEYLPKEIAYLDRLMKFTSIGIQNHIHHQGSITDFKTGLYNHSFFMARLEEELARVKRYGIQISIFMIDIDYFKRFNDTYGHMLGDEVLVQVAKIITGLTRREDVVSRFGGEEFIILMTDISKETSWRIADRIRQTIAEHPIEHGEKRLGITVSLGIRHITQYSYAPASALIEQADKALYSSKQKGRNCTSIFKAGLLFSAEKISYT